MEQTTISQFLSANKDFLFPNKEYTKVDIELALLPVPDQYASHLNNISFRSPTTALIISALLGSSGIDRFYMGDIGKGILKFITSGGLGVWWIIDIFSIKERCRIYNCEKLLNAISDPETQTQSTTNKPEIGMDTVKKYAPVAKEVAKGVANIGKGISNALDLD